MPNFTIEGRLKQLKDIQRNWMWELVIPAEEVSDQAVSEDLIIRCRNAIIPGRSFEPIESNFAGMKQFFAGKPAFANTFAATFEETEDQKMHKFFYDWMQKIFDVNPNSPTAGVSTGLVKRDLCRDIFLLEYKYNGDNLDKRIKFVNAWPQNIDDVTMDYTGNESVKYGITFQYDYWLQV